MLRNHVLKMPKHLTNDSDSNLTLQNKCKVAEVKLTWWMDPSLLYAAHSMQWCVARSLGGGMLRNHVLMMSKHLTNVSDSLLTLQNKCKVAEVILT